jgi:hypothetical protein
MSIVGFLRDRQAAQAEETQETFNLWMTPAVWGKG